MAPGCLKNIKLLNTSEPVGYNDRSIEGSPDTDGIKATGAGGARNGLRGVTLVRKHQMLGKENERDED